MDRATGASSRVSASASRFFTRVAVVRLSWSRSVLRIVRLSWTKVEIWVRAVARLARASATLRAESGRVYVWLPGPPGG